MRRPPAVLAPIAAGLTVFALALAYPASSVHGSGLTGPVVAEPFTNAELGDAYRTQWADHDRVILLRVRDGRRCEPVLRSRSSTGPARLEVRVALPSGPACTGHPRWWVLRLTPPPIRARNQPVALFVNGALRIVRPPGPQGEARQGTVQ